MKIERTKLKRLVTLLMEKRKLLPLIQEGKKFQAVRSLTIQAQQAAMKFEEEILDALNIKNPDDLDDHEQQVYAQAMADMHSKIIEAVVHASEVVKTLSEKPLEEKPAKGKAASSSSPAATGNTVNQSLPTL